MGDPNRIATGERRLQEINIQNWEISWYCGEFQVIATDLDWNPSALQNTLQIRLSEEMTDTSTYSYMPFRRIQQELQLGQLPGSPDQRPWVLVLAEEGSLGGEAK